MIQDVIVNQRTGKLLDGHLRLELAISEKQAEIPVKYVDLSESEEALVLATFDPVGSLAFLDLEEMSQLQSELAPNLDSPLAELIDRLSPDPVRDDVSHPPGPPSPRDPDSVGSTDDPGPAPEATDEPEQYLLRTPVRVIPMTHDEYRRLSDAFISYQESRGMWFGFVRWLCT